MEQAIADLRLALDLVEPRIRAFRADSKHWTAHLSLLGYLGDFLGNARAVLVLTECPETRLALWSNARLAFEAAQDALYLLTRENVDEAAGEIRAFERLEHADWKGKVALAFPEDVDGATYESVVNKEIERILRDASRAKHREPALYTAFEAALERRRADYRHPAGRKPSHWAGSRAAIARQIGERIGVDDEAQRQVMMYSRLSRFAHPRYRVDAHERWDGAPAFTTFIPTGAAIGQAVGITEIAANIMAMALNVFEGKPAAEGIPLVPGPDVPELD